MQAKTNTLQIRTPEGIIFSQIIAAPVTRCLAWAVDMVVIIGITYMVSFIVMLVSLISSDFSTALSILVYFVVSIGYGILMEWLRNGQTIGKKIMRLRVMDASARRLHFSQIVIRNLLRFIDSIPFFYLIGGITSLINRRSQRLGDIVANTVVIRSPKIKQPDLDQLLSGKYNSLNQYPHLTARLRQNASPQEAGIALQALLRREEFEPTERVRLFHDISKHFRSLVKFPSEATDGIADEQYIRNVVDILFRTR